MAGTADGAVLSYDLRAPARLLSAIQTHKQPLVSILLQPGGTDNLLITGSSDGQIAYCDLRNASKPFLMTEVSKPSSMPNRAPALTALAGHSCARVIASGSSERAIKLWDLHGNNTYTIQNATGFLGQRTGPVTVLAFHPNALYLAAGSTDGHATIFSR
jgi:regulator-associated protein of mTOR